MSARAGARDQQGQNHCDADPERVNQAARMKRSQSQHGTLRAGQKCHDQSPGREPKRGYCDLERRGVRPPRSGEFGEVQGINGHLQLSVGDGAI
jgi:hypothetical protein